MVSVSGEGVWLMGMWNVPLALFNSESYIDIYCTLDTLIGDLYAFLGSPSTPNNYNIIVDGCALGDVNITGSFPVGTTFQFTCINDGSIDGLGGDGGQGGGLISEFVPNQTAAPGANGSHAISSNTFDVGINIDNGYLRGGGGGGGGGGGLPSPATSPGGGGGAGAGFSITAGGLPGLPLTYPPATAGGNGGNLGPGVGGVGGGGSGTGADGGAGGNWGSGGTLGDSGDPAFTSFLGNFLQWWGGGAGGGSGNAFYASANNLATVTFNGSKSEATLRAESRLLGETEMRIMLPPLLATRVSIETAHTNPTNGVGYTFLNDGSATEWSGFAGIRSWQLVAGEFTLGGSIPHAAGNGDNYLVRASARANTSIDSIFAEPWDNTAGAAGTWIPLTSDQAWTFDIAASGTRINLSYFEIQRDGMGADEVIDGDWFVFENVAP
jgi:hypothetical protein